MYCTNCGKEINENSKFCNFCGQSITLKNDFPSDGKQVVNSTDVIKCPVCHNYDKVAKVSAVYSRGVSETSSSGSAVGVTVPFGGDSSPSITYMPVSMSGFNISELSKKLAPPSYPKKQSFGCYKAAIVLGGLLITWVLIVGFSFSIFAKLDGFINSGLTVFLTLFCVSCVILVWVLISFSFKKRQKIINDYFINEIDAYNTRYSKWNKYYYCFKDDVVFNPETGDFTSADNMYRFYI